MRLMETILLRKYLFGKVRPGRLKGRVNSVRLNWYRNFLKHRDSWIEDYLNGDSSYQLRNKYNHDFRKFKELEQLLIKPELRRHNEKRFQSC